MPLVTITAHLEGEAVLVRSFEALEARLSDATPAWPAVIQEFKTIAQRAFATEGASTGEAWPALAPRTQAERRRKGFPPAHPILQRTGRLMRAVTLESNENVVVDTPTYLGIAIDVPYFVYHQSNAPRRRLPRRAPLLYTADDRHALLRPVRRWMTGHDPNAPVQGAA